MPGTVLTSIHEFIDLILTTTPDEKTESQRYQQLTQQLPKGEELERGRGKVPAQRVCLHSPHIQLDTPQPSVPVTYQYTSMLFLLYWSESSSLGGYRTWGNCQDNSAEVMGFISIFHFILRLRTWPQLMSAKIISIKSDHCLICEDLLGKEFWKDKGVVCVCVCVSAHAYLLSTIRNGKTALFFYFS